MAAFLPNYNHFVCQLLDILGFILLFLEVWKKKVMHAGRNTLYRRQKCVFLLAIQRFNLTAATILTFPYLTSPCLPPVSLEWPVDSKWNVSEKKKVE